MDWQDLARPAAPVNSIASQGVLVTIILDLKRDTISGTEYEKSLGPASHRFVLASGVEKIVPSIRSLFIFDQSISEPARLIRRLAANRQNFEVVIIGNMQAMQRFKDVINRAPVVGLRYTCMSSEELKLGCLKSFVENFIVRSRFGSNIARANRKLHTLADVQRPTLESPLTDRKMAMAFSHSHTAIIVVDSSARIIAWNAGATRLLSCSAINAVSRLLDDVFVEYSGMDAVMHSVQMSASAEHMILCKHDSDRILSLDISPLGDQDSASSIFIFDLTEHVRTERRLREQAKELARSNADLEQFAYVASHDLQEPLKMISSFAELLERRTVSTLDDKSLGYLSHISQASLRLRAMVKGLLNYAVVARRSVLSDNVDLNAVLSDVLKNLDYIIKEKMAIIDVEPLPIILGDRHLLAQLFQNIISNGIKFQDRESVPMVHISTEDHANEWRIDVRDNGIGIPPSSIESIFKMFNQISERSVFPGTGIGLATCKRIVELHGGRITVESQKSLGSLFRITLPKCKT